MLELLYLASAAGLLYGSAKGIKNSVEESKFQTEFEENARKLIEYYKEKGLVIIGMNDSQGVNTTSTIFRQGMLDYLATSLTTEDFIPLVMNCFSLKMNKTEHIDYFLKNNLSLEEIKLSQIYSFISAIQKVFDDQEILKSFKPLTGILNAYPLIYRPKDCEKTVRLTSILQQSAEPILIYSSGVNNLMRSVGNNPFAIKSDYKKRLKKPNFNYTLEKSKDPAIINGVLEGIEKNFEHILSINEKTDLYALGAYVPASLRKEEMNIFRELVLHYNEMLQELCRKYQAYYVDTEEIGEKYNNSAFNFHISKKGHNKLANHILEEIYHHKIEEPQMREAMSFPSFETTDKGVQGMIYCLERDYHHSLQETEYLEGYAQEREYKIAEEHLREKQIFEKILRKKK